jgi:hypothetical protein
VLMLVSTSRIELLHVQPWTAGVQTHAVDLVSGNRGEGHWRGVCLCSSGSVPWADHGGLDHLPCTAPQSKPLNAWVYSTYNIRNIASPTYRHSTSASVNKFSVFVQPFESRLDTQSCITLEEIVVNP